MFCVCSCFQPDLVYSLDLDCVFEIHCLCVYVCVFKSEKGRQAEQKASMHKGAQVCVRKEGRVDKGNISFLFIQFSTV